ncbi:hypothetical protein SAMN02927900_01545 [Rhizobium mongolense subsp. loessense]|uniref:Uncharacterized protein n=1 Tax=Rhizobium mongolense subsp. loessense TaxID=158890 RepID=A0A1G4QK91_9HYPH|nr:hypothetical protein [Rhizobium mongolense]SCW45050.1 hypothetical protein SAMN02927900_01545 [Rhizobium mongolense subsp. loessense]
MRKLRKYAFLPLAAAGFLTAARGLGDPPRGRPPKKADKPQAAKDHEALLWMDDMARAAANSMRA